MGNPGLRSDRQESGGDNPVIRNIRTRETTKAALPQWLADGRADLDAAVAAAYGWDSGVSDEEALAKLLTLNLADEVLR